MAPALEILTSMEYAEDEDVAFAHTVNESERTHEELAHVRMVLLRKHRAAVGQDPEGVGREGHPAAAGTGTP